MEKQPERLIIGWVCCIRNWWENPCQAMGIWWLHFLHFLSDGIRWEYNGKRPPYYGKSICTNFSGSPHTMGFIEYYWEPISQALPIRWVWLSFSVLRKLMRKHMHFTYDEVYHRMGIYWEKSTHTMGKLWVSICQVLPI